jgi:hypothetical protein
VNFSEARDLFGINFQIAFMKIGGLRVDTQEVQGPFCKVTGIKELPDLISTENSVDRVHGAVDRGRRRSTVDRGHCLGGGSPENGWNGAPVHGTSPRLRKKGEGTAVSLIGCKRGRRRDGHGRAAVGNNRWRRRSVGWTLRTRERANEGGVSVVMAGGCSSPFYSGRRGACRGEGGGNGRR